MKRIEKDIKCKSCNGTGVYVGMAERDGAAVVCHSCKGTGKQHYVFEYEEFTGIQKRDDVSRVYKQSYGFVIAPRELNFEGIGTINMAYEGVSYEDFINGKMPEHTKQMVCPLLADQGACHKIPGFIDKCDELNGKPLLGCLISDCKNQINKLDCWERFNKGQYTYLLTMIMDGFKNANRMGSDKDDPEGGRYIQISDTFANDICAKIDKLIK
jgi:hypothetical protein